MDRSFLKLKASPVLIFLVRSVTKLCLLIKFEQY